MVHPQCKYRCLNHISSDLDGVSETELVKNEPTSSDLRQVRAEGRADGRRGLGAELQQPREQEGQQPGRAEDPRQRRHLLQRRHRHLRATPWAQDSTVVVLGHSSLAL